MLDQPVNVDRLDAGLSGFQCGLRLHLSPPSTPVRLMLNYSTGTVRGGRDIESPLDGELWRREIAATRGGCERFTDNDLS